MLGFISRWAEVWAGRVLAQLDTRIGSHGMAAATSRPDLVAAIDQHAAAVRDILTVGVDGPMTLGVVSLAGYAQGLLDHAQAKGDPIRVPLEWSGVDWSTTRLVAVCDLARRINEPTVNLDAWA